MNNNEILAMVFNCGYDDISIFDDTRSDVLEYAIEQAKEDSDLSLDNVFAYAFDYAFDKFCNSILGKKQELIERITPYAELNDDGEIELTAELEDVCIEYGYGYQTNVDNFSLLAQDDIEKLKMLNRDKLDNDFSYYFNYLDTHISCEDDSDFYSRLFKDELYDFFGYMGFNIENI